MKTITTFILIAAVAFGLAGCGAPAANNAPANTAANTAPKALSAPTVEALSALDKAATEAYFKGDAKYFETFLSDNAGGSMGGKHYTKADILKIIATAKCDVKDFKMEDAQMSPIDNDTAVLSYKATFDGSCTEGGKKIPTPSPVRAATVFVRSGDKWQAVWHTEIPIMEAKKEPDDKAAAKKDDAKKDEKAEAKKEDATREDATARKEEPKKEDNKPLGADKAAPADAAADGTASAPPMKPSANTDRLMELELGLWTAWKDKDAKAIDALAAKNLAFVDALGQWFGNRAATLKYWENTSGCTGVEHVALKNGFAWALSPTVEILTFDATADGSCAGNKLGTFNSMSVYVKEGDAWKLAFTANEPARKS